MLGIPNEVNKEEDIMQRNHQRTPNPPLKKIEVGLNKF